MQARLTLQTLLSIALLVAPSWAFADSPETDAMGFCDAFAQTISANATDCEAMGQQLHTLIDSKRGLLGDLANLENPEVEAYCSMLFDGVADELNNCFETPAVLKAMGQLQEIEDEATKTEAKVLADKDIRAQHPELAALELYCVDLRAAVENYQGDCQKLATTVADRTAEWQKTEVPAHQVYGELEGEFIGRAMANCTEAIAAIPAECSAETRLQEALGISE